MFNVKRTKYVEGFDSLSGQKEDFSFEFWLEVKDDPLTVYFPGDHEGDLTGWVGTEAGQVRRDPENALRILICFAVLLQMYTVNCIVRRNVRTLSIPL